MKLSFEEVQVIVSTAMLLPALVALIVLGVRRRLEVDPGEQWDPRSTAEHDWWEVRP